MRAWSTVTARDLENQHQQPRGNGSVIGRRGTPVSGTLQHPHRPAAPVFAIVACRDCCRALSRGLKALWRCKLRLRQRAKKRQLQLKLERPEPLYPTSRNYRVTAQLCANCDLESLYFRPYFFLAKSSASNAFLRGGAWPIERSSQCQRGTVAPGHDAPSDLGSVPALQVVAAIRQLLSCGSAMSPPSFGGLGETPSLISVYRTWPDFQATTLSAL